MVGQRVGEQRAVRRRLDSGQRNRAVGAERVRIEQHARDAARAVLHVQDRLRQQARIVAEEVAPAPAERRRRPRHS